MSGDDKKFRGVARQQLGHLDAFIMRHLLDRPDPATPDQIDAVTTAVLIDILDCHVGDVDGFEPTGWAARIVASLPEGDEDGDGLPIMLAEQAEPLVPEHEKAALREAVKHAAAELRKLRAMNQREIDKAYAVACEERLRRTKTVPEADWDVWLAKPSWTIEETVALLFGKDPNDLHATSKDLPDWVRSAFAAKLDHLKRLVGAGVLKNPAIPQAVREWASKHEPNAPAQLHILPPTPEDRTESNNAGKLHHLTLKMYYHTLLHLAVIHHGYDPVEAAAGISAGKPVKSRTPAAISEALIKSGFEGSDKTIRKHLALAVAAFEAEYGYAALEKLAKHRKLPSTKL